MSIEKESAEKTPLFYAKASVETMMRKFRAQELPPKGHFHYHQGVFRGVSDIPDLRGQAVFHLHEGLGGFLRE